MESSTLLSLENLCVWYTAAHPVLSHFSIDLRANEIVGLIGRNGSGKTTFIKTVAGLLQSYQNTAPRLLPRSIARVFLRQAKKRQHLSLCIEVLSLFVPLCLK